MWPNSEANSSGSSSVIPRVSAEVMVESYLEAMREIEGGYDLLMKAEDRLQQAFENRYGFGVMGTSRFSPSTLKAEAVICVRQAAWKAITEKVMLRQVMSMKKAKELDAWLEARHTLPEITLEAVHGMCMHMTENLDGYLTDAVKEVFDYLRPHKWDKFKTNREFEIGAKIIKSGPITRGYGNSLYQVNHWHEQYVKNLDNVFSLLDGKGPITTYKGPLQDAIEASDGVGETDYFRFKCFKNSNLHLEVRRLDLLARLNQIGGAGTLRNDQKKLPAFAGQRA